MPRNASGTYTLPSGNPVVSGTLIEADWANSTLNDIANELTDSLSRSGEGGMLAPFRLADGLQASPGIAWLNEPSTGFYREGSGEMWGVVGGAQILQYTATGVLVPTGKTLTANGGITATTLTTSGLATLNSASVTGNLSVGGTLTLTGGLTLNGNVTVGDAATDTLTINSTITSNLIFTDNTYDIGASGATRPRNLFLAGNGVIGGTLGVSGILTASSGISGNVTGNLTGNVTGSISGGTVAGSTGTFSSNVTVGGTLGVTGATTLSSTLGVTGATTLSSTLGVTGATTLSSTVDVTGALTASGGSVLNGGVVVNELGADADFRVEGDTDANLLFVDASTDRVGFGTNTPTAKLDIVADPVATFDGVITGVGKSAFGLTTSSDSGSLTIEQNLTYSGRESRIVSNKGLALDGTSGVYLLNNNTERLSATSSGIVINDSGADVDFRVEGDTDSNLLFVDASEDNIGIGTNSTDTTYRLTVQGVGTSGNPMGGICFRQGATDTLYVGSIATDNDTDVEIYNPRNGYIRFATNNLVHMLLDASGNLGLGVTPSAWNSNRKALQVGGAASSALSLSGTSAIGEIFFNSFRNTGADYTYVANGYAGSLTFNNEAAGGFAFNLAASGTAGNTITFTQAMTLDASGNLGVGTSSPQSPLHIAATNNEILRLQTTDATTGGIFLSFYDSAAAMKAYLGFGGTGDDNLNIYNVENAPITFGTNNTERARITSGGIFAVGVTNPTMSYGDPAGFQAGAGVDLGITLNNTDGTPCAFYNRKTNDGDLLVFAQDNTTEGSISVSGNTVSYNAFAGSHWSQLQDGSKPDILRGTVMESINELCEWPGEENERLPKAKISDTAGSKKVYGVFMAWDNDWTETNDMYVTAVGAFICRVNGSVTVQEGDLLESNGDGTARVQADDIIRSSTIGKVTSTVKTHEYDDGSYCVPTVLYCG